MNDIGVLGHVARNSIATGGHGSGQSKEPIKPIARIESKTHASTKSEAVSVACASSSGTSYGSTSSDNLSTTISRSC